MYIKLFIAISKMYDSDVNMIINCRRILLWLTKQKVQYDKNVFKHVNCGG